MKRSAPLARRSPADWAVRGAMTLVAAVVGYGSVSSSLGYALRASDPARARALAPWDGRVTAMRAASLAGVDASVADRRRADRLAEQAVRQDATAIVAVSTLGIDAQIRGDSAGARRWFAYSQTLSRRDLQTQVWAIEDAVGRGDVANALTHYDIALRTSRDAGDLLFPILASALPEPAIRSALIAKLAGRPRWGGAFVDYVAGNGPDARATAKLFFGLTRAGVAVPPAARAAVVNRMVDGGHVDDAWAYYATYTPGVDRRRARDADFAAALVSPSVFDWAVVENSGASSSIQSGENGRGQFDFSPSATAGGAMLQQMQTLPSGSYALEAHSVGIEQPDGARPYWSLTCRDGRELGRIEVPPSAQRGGWSTGRFSVPTDCPAQMLSLVARPADGLTGAAGQITHVALAPVGTSDGGGS